MPDKFKPLLSQHDCTTFIVPDHVNRDLSFVAYRTDFNSSSPRPAEKSWRRLDGHNQLPKVVLGVKFADGIEVIRSLLKSLPPDPSPRFGDSSARATTVL